MKVLIHLAVLFFSIPVFAANEVKDDPAYQYQPNSYCGACHQEQLRDYSQSMMGKTPHDKVFQQFYLGLNAKGEKDGMGYKGFHPDEPGDCANCHTPDVVLNEGHEVDLTEAIDKGSQGISCDFCHTVADVRVIRDPDTGRYTTDINHVVTRARGDTKRGPYDDAVSPAHKTVMSPIHLKSEFCAMCHLNQEHLLSISTYADWKAAYDKGAVTQQCQECHMPTGGKDRPVAIGGKVRKAETIRRHLFHGGHSKDMLDKAATLKLEAGKKDGVLVVDASVTNSGAGHTLPGGATLRNIILVVDAQDAAGNHLQHLGGKQEKLPPLAGVGNTERDFAGHPGKMFARPFVTKTGMVPAGGFNADHELFNTRIPPRETDHSTFHFTLPEKGAIKVTARLIYRWTYKPMADKKGWDLEDIEMTRQSVEVD
ncbi:cytochrome c554/c'-like protein [Thiogranum longum]|uniref:Cytochrome c554/c'-like protein n=1 Tax=Thiogranum longum TaxID=1537524 RepID=A0A4R1HCP1_9GAMM|nr:multiheme c-type cytochrome [Thiogranum longum]TCK17980.1 cytochrome c554/c'-like protein [Thiogranum longum]